MTKRAALILAGGKARRFQSKNQKWQDKALAQLSGKPLLIHSIENVQGVVDEIIVSVNDEERKTEYAQILKEYGFKEIQVVIDEKNNSYQWPNRGHHVGVKSCPSQLLPYFTL